MIIASAPVQRIGFFDFADLVRTLGSGLGDYRDRGLGLGLGLDKRPENIEKKYSYQLILT